MSWGKGRVASHRILRTDFKEPEESSIDLEKAYLRFAFDSTNL
jgi:hypothetical protein